MITYPYSAFGCDYQLALVRTSYSSNDKLAVQAYTDTLEPFATITVNIFDSDYCEDDCAFIDVNNCPGITDFLVRNKIAKPTGRIGLSGFCSYPEYKFDLTKLEEE